MLIVKAKGRKAVVPGVWMGDLSGLVLWLRGPYDAQDGEEIVVVGDGEDFDLRNVQRSAMRNAHNNEVEWEPGKINGAVSVLVGGLRIHLVELDELLDGAMG